MADTVKIVDWEPGDGLNCAYSRGAQLIPCGLPVKTRVAIIERADRGKPHVRRTALCENHAAFTEDLPHVIIAKANKAATERLVVSRREEFVKYREEAIQKLLGSRQGSSS